MKIVFLDMDGVLNSDGFIAFSREKWPGGHINPEKVAILNRIMDRSGGAQVVLSSTWRLLIGLPELTAALRTKGYTGPDLMDRTPGRDNTIRKLSEYVPRRKEIKAWLKEHPEVTSYVILDDDGDARIGKRMVHTSCIVGLQDGDVDLALEILDEALP